MAPGTSSRTNPNAMATITRNTIFTNVGQRSDGGVFWEGLDEPTEPGVTFTSWLGKPWKPGNGWLGLGGGVGGPRVGSTWGQNGGLGVPVLLVGVKMASFGVNRASLGAKMASVGSQDGVCGVNMASVGSQDGVCGVLMVLDGAKMASVHSVTSDPGCDP